MPDEPDVMLGYHDPNHAVAIMRAISMWASFEYGFAPLIWDLARLEPDMGGCLTAQFTDLRSRFDAVTALVHVRKLAPSHIKNLEKLQKASDKLRGQRNRLVHDQWFFGAESEQHYQLRLTARGKLTHDYATVTEADLDQMVKEIEALNARFDEIAMDIRRELWPGYGL